MKIDKLIKDFLQEVKLKHAKGTLKYYQSHLGHFKNYADKIKISEVSEITEDVIVDYVAHMKETNESITINKNIGALKLAFRSCKIKNTYLMSIPKLKVRNRTFDMVEEQDLRRIRTYIRSIPGKVGNNLYYRMMILLLMDTGCRARELMLIEKKNVNLEDREILLTQTKTNEDRLVYFSEPAAQAIKRFFRQYPTNHQYLMHNILKNRPGSYDDIVYVTKYLKKALGLKKLHAHMFRHSMTTIWLQNGADLHSVMEVLGHKNIETTQRYWHKKKDHTRKMYIERFNLD